MIGVVARPEDHNVVREFFELFKTPWELCREGRRYRVVLHADPSVPCPPADLVVRYGSRQTAHGRPGIVRSRSGERLPLYGPHGPLPSNGAAPELLMDDGPETVAFVERPSRATVVRVGYNLFEEVRFLLTAGQPAALAAIPSLERHIDLLRGWITGGGIPLVEIPPVPEGYRFIVCLTHDLDHPSVRFHKLDHTTFGFLKRALVDTPVQVCRGHASLGALRRNLVAALRLPFIHLGWAEDFWATGRRYQEIERGLGSTFFAIPMKRNPGRTLDGPAPGLRASAYGVADIEDQVTALVGGGSEIGVHGIDAWIDSDLGSSERQAVSRVAKTPAAGVRMHWLYFDEHAPERLERAGFDYDSTFGYNDAVGFRAGTLQAFKPLTARRLLELPLHVMDTALFYPTRLGLSPEAAWQAVLPLIDEAERHGGALTINWHDRSIAPERLWDGFYLNLLAELKRRRAWFPTAAQAVAWFRRRRAATFDAAGTIDNDAPGFTLRKHEPRRDDRMAVAGR
jgi:hypothetical protein